MCVFYEENQLMHLIVTFICKQTGNTTAEDKNQHYADKTNTRMDTESNKAFTDPLKLANLGFFFIHWHIFKGILFNETRNTVIFLHFLENLALVSVES